MLLVYRFHLVSLLVIVFGVVALYAFGARAPGATGGPVMGVNCGSWTPIDPNVASSVGAKLVRVEWGVGASAPNMDSTIGAYAAKGIGVQPLAGFYGRLPSTQEAQNLRNWALRFGPNGTYWQGRSDGHLAAKHIEFGNETSYGYQYGDGYASASYAQRARDYALRAREAAIALQGTGVGLLVQGEDGGSGSSMWLDQMFAAVPNLPSYAAGWTVHPYGPTSGTLSRLRSQLAARGENSIPFYITEWGLATDNGANLNDNYGYPTNMTYSQAATALRDAVASWQSTYGGRVAQVLLYQCRDQEPSGASNEREMYFGVVQREGADKGAFTAEVRAQIGNSTTTPAPSPPPPNQPPIAAATAAPTSGVVPFTVSFSGAASSDTDGSIAAWAWDLDSDGQYDDSTAKNPTRQYTVAGTYTIRLRVTDNQGAQDASDPVTVTATAPQTAPPAPAPPPPSPEPEPPPAPAQPPAVSPTGVEKAQGKPSIASSYEGAPWFEPRFANDGNATSRWSSVYADNQWWQVDLGSLRKVDTVQVTWNTWAWPRTYSIAVSGDGSTFTTVAQASLSTSGTSVLTFPLRSARYVRVTGNERATTASLSIEEAKVFGPADTAPNQPPVAIAGASPLSGTAPLAVNFSSAGSADADGSIAAWAWDLDGDGQYDDSTARSPSKQYGSAGTYNARLRVTDNQGAQDASDTVAVTVRAASVPTPTPLPPAPEPSPAPAPEPSPDAVEKAHGRPATASSYEGAPWFEPRFANDGDSVTRWSSVYADNQWWQVDLGTIKKVDSVQVTWNKWAWPRTYSVAVSGDGSNWTTVANHALLSWGTHSASFGTRSARYVRIIGHIRATPASLSIQEAKVFGPPDTTAPTPAPAPAPAPTPPPMTPPAPAQPEPAPPSPSVAPAIVEKAEGKPATASSQEGAPWFEPRFGNDGNANTRWSSVYADNQWWQVDLGSLTKVERVEVTWNEWAWPRTYTVAVSSDGSSWTPVANGALLGSGTHTVSFDARSARYVRVTGHTRATPASLSIEEAKVFGPAGS